MSPAQGHISQLLVNGYVYDSVGDLTALTVGIAHIGSGGFKCGYLEGLHHTLLSVASMHVCGCGPAIPNPERRYPRIPEMERLAHTGLPMTTQRISFAPRGAL
jgi:hypothetical protein